MAAGKIISGIVLIVLGIFFFGPSHWAFTATYYDLERCNSLTRGPGQELDQENYQYCQNMILVNSISLVGMIVGSIFVLIGLVLVIIGIITGKKDKKKVGEIKDSNINMNSDIESQEIREEKVANQSPMSIHKTNNPIIENKRNDNNEYLSRLEKLAEMKKNGILTQDEFNILKGDIIKKFGITSIGTINPDTRVTNTEYSGTTKDSEGDNRVL
ncbi:MAG TPA: SHOCT domain-containing protein [Nitrososphaeraceae archaeon]|nr:SHOCT domain-containing protein [Nitrososphaeraceae archaeon]